MQLNDSMKLKCPFDIPFKKTQKNDPVEDSISIDSFINVSMDTTTKVPIT